MVKVFPSEDTLKVSIRDSPVIFCASAWLTELKSSGRHTQKTKTPETLFIGGGGSIISVYFGFYLRNVWIR